MSQLSTVYNIVQFYKSAALVAHMVSRHSVVREVRGAGGLGFDSRRLPSVRLSVSSACMYVHTYKERGLALAVAVAWRRSRSSPVVNGRR